MAARSTVGDPGAGCTVAFFRLLLPPLLADILTALNKAVGEEFFVVVKW